MSASLEAMSSAELLGFAIYIIMTVAFFVWVAYLAISK